MACAMVRAWRACVRVCVCVCALGGKQNALDMEVTYLEQQQVWLRENFEHVLEREVRRDAITTAELIYLS